MSNNIISLAYKSSDTVTAPGKFQNEPVWAEHFWNTGLEYGFDFEFTFEGQLWGGCNLNADDRQRFPALRDIHAVLLHETDQGFIMTALVARGYNECIGCGDDIIDSCLCDECEERGERHYDDREENDYQDDPPDYRDDGCGHGRR